MGARVQDVPDPTPVANNLDQIVKYRGKENAGIDTLAGAAKLMNDYVVKETDTKKKAKAKKIASALDEMTKKMWADYTSATKKIQDKAKEIRRL